VVALQEGVPALGSSRAEIIKFIRAQHDSNKRVSR